MTKKGINKKKEKLVLIDSNALLHRAFHALPPLSKKDGTITNAVYGYITTLLSVIDKLKPEYILATFDLKGPTFRHKKFEGYKAKRVKAPDEFYQQIPLAKKMLEAFNIPIFEKNGFEADDLIGTLVKNPDLDGKIEKIIVTGDLDTLQLIDENTKVFTLRRGITDTIIYDQKAVENRFSGLKPVQMIDYKALRGDQSDNIPGVKGIGEKTATELLIKYKNLDGVYENLEKISSVSTRKKLIDGRKDAYMSYELGKIRTDVPVDFNLKSCRTSDYDKKKAVDFLKEMEFFSLIKRIGIDAGKAGQSSGKADAFEIKILDAGDASMGKIEKAERIAVEFLKEQGLGIALNEGTGYFISGNPREILRKIFINDNIKKIGFNLKKTFKAVFQDTPDEMDKIRNYSDVEILAYLLKSGTKINLEKLVLEEFGAGFIYQTTKKGQTSLLSDNSEIEKKEKAEKAAWIWQLEDIYQSEIKKISEQQEAAENRKGATLSEVMENLEKPLIKILAKMEIAGVKIAAEILNETSKEVEKELFKLENEIHKLAREKFNISSPSQLALILYEKLKISTQEIRKGKTGYSTDADQLRKIRRQHPIIKKIENYRELSKIKSTYTDALPKLMEKDGRIHALFNQAVTATGRLSSSEPNLQNIPKKGKLAANIRRAFVADKGKILVSADYSQIDLRVAAHLSGDEKMIEIFQKNKDIHRTTASWVNNIEEEKITDEQRNEAKSLNFGVLYGMGIYGFMRDSGVTRERAEFFIDQYMKKFSGLKKYLDNTKKFAKENGYVETEMGRRRYIQNINSSNFQLKNMAERMAINLPIQGLSADIMKLAMVKVENEILSHYSFDKARLILQIHDELIFEVEKELADKFAEEVKKNMENAYKLRVPLLVDIAKGENWEEL